MIEHSLEQLGFTEKEIKVYLCVMRHGKMTPVSIARLTHINRTTVYTIASVLTKKGLLIEDKAEAIQTFIARDPAILSQSIRKEEEELQEKKDLVARTISQLQSLSKDSKYSIPKIMFVEEDEINDHLYRQAPLWNLSVKERETEYYGYQDASFVQYYKDWIDWYWKQEDSKGISLKLISNEPAEDLIDGKKYSRRQIRFWKRSVDFTASTWVMGDYIAMIITSESPRYLVEIHDRTMAHNMREIFKGLWEEVIEK